MTHFFGKREMLARMFGEIASTGAASAPILDDICCRNLLAESESKKYAFTPEKCEQGKEGARVYQQLETFGDFPPDSVFLFLRDVFEACLGAYADSLSCYPFSFAPAFHSLTLARYPAGSIGITPHRDHLMYKNLICIFVLGGKGRFFICADRAGRSRQEIDASVGNIIMLRSPGFLGVDKRPFHFITDITIMRHSFILRQEAT